MTHDVHVFHRIAILAVVGACMLLVAACTGDGPDEGPILPDGADDAVVQGDPEPESLPDLFAVAGCVGGIDGIDGANIVSGTDLMIMVGDDEVPASIKPAADAEQVGVLFIDDAEQVLDERQVADIAACTG